VIPIEQSRIGERGTCFRACLASLLNLREDQVPDFPDANQDSGVDKFLRRFGLHYNERPIDRGDPPRGWHVILGESPRGGEHAVVGYNGIFRHDPHPIWDDRRRGLVDEKAWGELLPLKREAKDSKKEAEALRARHDEIVSSHLRGVGNSAETAYRSLHQPMIGLLHDAEALLAKTRLDDDQAYWRDKISDAKRHLAESERCASIRNWSLATSYLDAALTMAHTVIDKLRNTGGGRRARDMAHTVIDKLRNTGRGRARDAKESKYIDGPTSDGEYSAGVSIDGNTAQRAGFKTYGDATDWVRVMLQKIRQQKATAADSSNRRARLHAALDRVLDSHEKRRVRDAEKYPQPGWRVDVDRVGGGIVEGQAPRMNGIGGVFLVKMDKGGTMRVHRDRMTRVTAAKDSVLDSRERQRVRDVGQYEVRKSHSQDAWAVFKVGDDFPESGWFTSKSKAIAKMKEMGGAVIKPKSQEAAARERMKATERNPTVRNYFKLDQ
jgi:hypothetical protein